MKVIAYDFETTGVNPRECEPVQLAAVEVELLEDGNYRVLSEFESILKPEGDIPEGATAVHGISTERAKAEGVCPSVVSREVQGVVLGYNNMRFDDTIAKRYGAKIGRTIDIFVGVSRLKQNGVIGKANLSDAYEALVGKPAENAHDALADVYMTLDLIRPLMAELGHDTVDELITDLTTFKANPEMLMPFGKHKGVRIKDLPPNYLRWAKENMTLHGELRAAFEAVWG